MCWQPQSWWASSKESKNLSVRPRGWRTLARAAKRVGSLLIWHWTSLQVLQTSSPRVGTALRRPEKAGSLGQKLNTDLLTAGVPWGHPSLCNRRFI